jgi:two-component system sensor histidine kinase BaeS
MDGEIMPGPKRTGPLIVKLLGINVLIIGFVIVAVWLSIDYLAAGYFSELMEIYHIDPEASHTMFLHAAHRYMIWASVGALVLAALFCFLLMRRVLTPLSLMTRASLGMASGDYSRRVPVHSRDEIGQLAAAFNHMADGLQHLERQRTQLMIDVAHELKTPLTNIKGYLEALVDGVLPPSRKNFELLQEETQRLVQLVENILRLARAEAASKTLFKEALALAPLIEKALAGFRFQFQQRSLRVNLNIRPTDISLWADPRMMGQVLRNLMENAAHYTPTEEVFTIQVTQSDGAVHLRFSNPCRSLTQEDLPLLFERFYRSEKSRSRQFGGAGIGLAIVKELVQAHDGSIAAELDGGQFTIQITLPQAQQF